MLFWGRDYLHQHFGCFCVLNGCENASVLFKVHFVSIAEISSDGATRSSQCMDDDLREMRLSLLMEIERRKQAEEALENWQKEWKKLSDHLSVIALTLPPPSLAEDTDDSSMDPGAELCQQITVSQLVAAAIARGFARAEVETDMETKIAAKNFEIARLSDRVQYYEAANREMSQRNQEAIGTHPELKH